MRKPFLFVVAMAFLGLTNAQQAPQTYLYNFNSFLINPAYSGLNNCMDISLAHHNQWVKIEGAPNTNYLTISSRIGQKIGVGGQFMLDKIGMIQQVSGLGNISYGLLSGKHTLRLGASFGYNNYRVNPSSAIAFDALDPIVNGGNQSAGAITTDLGIMYRIGELELMGSVKQLLKTYSNFGYSNLPGYGQRPHFFFGAGYQLNLAPNWGLRPNVMMRNINNVTQVDINADATYKKFLHMGIGFRSQVGVVARAGILLKEKFFIGYAYEAPLANIASYSSGSHEVILKMTLCRPEKIKTSKIKADTVIRTIEKVDTLYITKIEKEVDTIYINNSPEIKTTPVPPELGNVEKTILFAFDKSLVKKESYGELESIVNLLQLNPTYKVSLEGHTDAMGTEMYNVDLSKNRVNAVKDFLVMNGISSDRILINHHGETKPKNTNATPEERQTNRRVDVQILRN